MIYMKLKDLLVDKRHIDVVWKNSRVCKSFIGRSGKQCLKDTQKEDHSLHVLMF